MEQVRRDGAQRRALWRRSPTRAPARRRCRSKLFCRVLRRDGSQALGPSADLVPVFVRLARVEPAELRNWVCYETRGDAWWPSELDGRDYRHPGPGRARLAAVRRSCRSIPRQNRLEAVAVDPDSAEAQAGQAATV